MSRNFAEEASAPPRRHTVCTAHGMDPPNPPQPRQTRRDESPPDGRLWKARFRGASRTLAFVVLSGLLGYAGGRLQARTKMAALEQQAATAQVAHERALAQATRAADRSEAQRDRLADLAVLSAALRETQHALDALDARNFGIAQRDLTTAERHLGGVLQHVDGVDALRATITSTDVTVAANLSDQRREVATLVNRLDEIVARYRDALQVAPLLAGEVKATDRRIEATRAPTD
jgi:hypothetical protein